MAYLDNSDDKDQQAQAQSSGSFNAFSDGGAPQQQDTKSQGAGQSLNSWIGSGGAGAGGSPSSSDTAQENAKGYQSTYAGDGNVDAKSEASAGSQATQAPTMQQGLSGSGTGTGYINFQNYQDNAPSQAAAITQAGQTVIGGENTNLDNAEAPIKAANASAGAAGSPGSTQTEVDNGIAGLLDPANVTNLMPGSAAQGEISNWINPTTEPTTVNYTPGQAYTQGAPELTQTPVAGGQTAPSVVDYLAKDQIAAGGYSAGDRGLDQNLIAGDTGAQAAIKGNQALNATLQGRVANEVPAIQGQATANNTAAAGTAAMVQQGLTDTATTLQNAIATATAAANANPTPSTVANENAAIQAYAQWYNSGGQNGGSWTQSGTGQGQTALGPVDPKQATEADAIWKLQHPGDTDPSHLPYPDPSHAGNAPGASTWGGSGTAGAAPVTSLNQTEDAANSGTGGTAASVLSKYLDSGDVGTPGGKSLSGQVPNASPAETAVYNATHPGGSTSSPADNAAAAYQLQQLIGLIQSAPAANYQPGAQQQLIAKLTGDLTAVQKAGAAPTAKDPYTYGKSLGMTDAQLAGMGIQPPTPQATSNVGGSGPGPIKNLK